MHNLGVDKTTPFSEDKVGSNEEYEVVFCKDENEDLPSLIAADAELEEGEVAEDTEEVVT